MSESGGSGVPAPRPEGGNLPGRRLSSHELEAVIRRAVELQAASSAAPDEGIPEGEVLRIGQELGLDPVAVRRALTEVRTHPPEEGGALTRAMGPGAARAARTVRRPAAAVGLLVEEYLRGCEYMVVQRRFADRTRYVRDAGLAASFGRLARSFGREHQPLDLKQLDVAVSALDGESSLVELSVDLGVVRTGLAAGGALGGGGAAAGVAATVLATPILDPFALLGVPVLAVSWLAMRGIYGAVQRSTQEKLESFLDRLEHGDLRLPDRRPPWNRGSGTGGIAKLWKI
jgi:hypothetical protein